MRIPKTLLTAAVLWAAVSMPQVALADCNGEPCVLIYRGDMRQSQTFSPDGSWAKEVELADLDGDGSLDVVMAQKQPFFQANIVAPFEIRPGNNLDLSYLGRGGLDGLSFALDPLLPQSPGGRSFFNFNSDAFPVNFETTRSYDLEIADLDGDGHLDILRPDTPGILTILWGDGTGHFPQVLDVFSQLVPAGDPNIPRGCEVAFIDGNSPADNDGGNYDDVDLADLDGDGDLDFLVAEYSYQPPADCRSLVFENLAADGQPRSFDVVDVAAFASRNTHSVSLGDANQDGHIDVLLDHGSGFRPQLFLATSSNFTWGTTPSFTFSNLSNGQPTTVGDLVDLTGDGWLDAFFAKGFDGGDFGLWVNTQNAGTPFTPPKTTCTGTCPDDSKYDVRYADFDLDGQVEAIFARINQGEAQSTGNSVIFPSALQVFRFDAATGPPGGFADASAEFVDDAYAGQNLGGTAVATGDLDGDGDLDLVLGGVVDVANGQPDDVDLFGAVHVFENRTLMRLADRDPLLTGTLDLLALKVLSSSDITVGGGAQVTFEAGDSVVLGDGFTASPGAGGSFVARILP
ncbi:MAG: hypothetical protein AAGN66_17720 [Acidobacteriota bacterium]